MSKERIKISEDLYDIMPSDYQDLVKSATYGKEDRGWKDIGSSKELIEQHSLCAGCPESMAFRYILASLPNPETPSWLALPDAPVWCSRWWQSTTSTRCSVTRTPLRLA